VSQANKADAATQAQPRVDGGALIGVGVGPGDPGLITVKAVEALAAADRVFVPVAAEEADAPGCPPAGYAEAVMAAHIDPSRIERLAFALGAGRGGQQGWDAAGEAIAAAVDARQRAAFATIGDPNLYATFTYVADAVRARLDDVAVETVPGITALQDLASRAGVTLASGRDSLALLPFTAGDQMVSDALATFDTVVAYKGGRYLPRLRSLIEAAGRLPEAVFGARLGLAGQEIAPLGERSDEAPYLSTVIVAGENARRRR
jgi:precorrin-2/cobalt-factor-2 C20-methyltransferase